MKVYYVRHGQTMWNKKRRLQGQVDIPLNDEGREMARAARKAMADIPFDAAFTSPLSRARETAQILLEGRALPLREDERLLEISFGRWEGQSLRLIHRFPFLRMHNMFYHPERYVPSGKAESYEALMARARDFVEQALAPLEEHCQNVLVVAHGCIIRGTVCAVENIPLEGYWKGPPYRNCTVSVLELGEGRPRFVAEGAEPAELPLLV